MLGPIVEMKAEHQLLIGGRLVDLFGSSLAALVGRRRPTLKLAAVAALISLAYAAFAEGDFRISGKALVEGAIHVRRLRRSRDLSPRRRCGQGTS